jgi:hypothetical protein
MQSPLTYFVALICVSAIVATLFGRFVSRRFPRPLLVGLTLATALSLLGTVIVFTRPLKTEAAVYVYAEIAVYLILFLIFALPITIVGWLFRPKRVS